MNLFGTRMKDTILGSQSQWLARTAAHLQTSKPLNLQTSNLSASVRACRGGRARLSLNPRIHLEHQFAAGHDVGVADFPVGDRLAVERHGLDVLVLF